MAGSGLTFEMAEALLTMRFAESGEVTVDLADPRLRSQVNGGFLGRLANGPWRIPYWKVLLMTHLSPEITLNLKVVSPTEDGHALITRDALASLAIYLGVEEEAAPILPREVSARDMPPLPHANYVSLLASYFRPAENTGRHALRTVQFDPATGQVTLQSQEETQAGIRESLDAHLSAINRINRELEESSPIFIPGPEMDFLSRELSAMLTSFDTEDSDRPDDTNGDTGGEDTFDPGRVTGKEALVAGIQTLRPHFYYAQMRDVRFPNNDSADYDKREYLEVLAKPYRDVLRLIEESKKAFEEARRGIPGAFDKGVGHFRNLLRYIPEENWEKFAGGGGPLTAIRQLRLAASLHLTQDYVAHCIEWNPADPDVCAESVSVNLFGLGTLHSHENDSLSTPDGDRKREKAEDLSVEIIRLAQVVDEGAFQSEKEEFLNRYWPLECLPED